MRRAAGALAAALGLWMGAAGLTQAAPAQGLAMFGEPKYGPDFTHFEYVNPDAPKGGEARFGVLGTFDSLNPYILKGNAATGLALLFDTLLEPAKDEPFSAYGLLAETVEVAADRRSVTFRLRKEARFSDGSPVTAHDVAFSFATLKEKGHPSYRSYYRDVTGCAATDARTVTCTFATAENRELPLILGQLPVLSKAYYDRVDFTKTTLEPPLGSGPYRVEKADVGRSISYRRNPDYWGKDLPVNRGRYNFDRLTYDYYRDETVAVESLKAGNYDMRLENISRIWATGYETPALRAGMLKKEAIEHEVPGGMQGFLFNLRRPKFQDAKVREALIYAFDFEWANKNLFYSVYTRSRSYFTNSLYEAKGLPEGRELELLEPFRDRLPERVFTEEYRPPVTTGEGGIRANLLKAKTLLAEAGWTVQDGALRHPDHGAFTIECLIDTPAFERAYASYVRNLERLGIKASIRLVDSAQFQKRLEQFDFDVITHVFPQSLSPGNEQIDFWHSSTADVQGSRNLIGIKNPVVDAMIDRIIGAPDKETLIAAVKALDRVLQWHFYVLPNWHSRQFRVVYWNRFDRPATPPKYDLGFVDTWWINAEKNQAVQRYLKR